jgi:hypothetical protein
MHPITTTLAALGACAATGVANADLAVKAQIDIARQPAGRAHGNRHAAHNAIALYFQGDRARLEMPNGITALFNGSRNRVYIVNDRNQTYYATTLPVSQSPARPRAASAGSTVTLTHPESSPTQMIAGTLASKFSVFGSTDFSTIPTRFSRADDGSEDLGTRGTIKMDGELWASDSLRLPTRSALVLSAITSLVAYGATELQQPLQSQLVSLNEFPLRSRITLLRSDRLANTSQTTQVVFAVTSVAYDALPQSLFEVPSGYTQIDSGSATFGGNGSSLGPSGSSGSRSWSGAAGSGAGGAATSPGDNGGDVPGGIGGGDGPPPPGGDGPGGGPGGAPGGGPEGGPPAGGPPPPGE